MTFDRLRKVIEHLNPLTDESWLRVQELLVQRQVSAGQQLLQAGQKASSIFFLNRGLLREFYVSADGDEATRRFCQEGELSGSLADLLSGSASMSSIEVIEEGEVWQFEWRAFDWLTKTCPDLMLVSRRFAEQLYLIKSRREFEMLTLSAADRYRRFIAEYPVLANRLPRHLIASYLGITPMHLSRLHAAETSKQAR